MERMRIPHDSASPREARVGLARSLTFYKYERPHHALAYRTPAEVDVLDARQDAYGTTTTRINETEETAAPWTL
jgi:hypothetical protein